MTAPEYLAALAKVGLDRSTAGQFFGAHRVTGYKWASAGPPESVAMLLRLMIRLEYTPEQIKKLIGAD